MSNCWHCCPLQAKRNVATMLQHQPCDRAIWHFHSAMLASRPSSHPTHRDSSRRDPPDLWEKHLSNASHHPPSATRSHSYCQPLDKHRLPTQLAPPAYTNTHPPP